MKMISILNIKNITVRCLHVVTNTYTTLEAQFIKKLNSTEADLKKPLLRKKACSRSLPTIYNNILKKYSTAPKTE